MNVHEDAPILEVKELRLLPICVTRPATPKDDTDLNHVVSEVNMRWVDSEEKASFSLTFSNGQLHFLSIDDNPFEITPPEISHILYELGDLINAQLYVKQSDVRLVGAEYWWAEKAPVKVLHRSRQSIVPSVLEQLLKDPTYQPKTTIARPVKTDAISV